jgi:glutamine synthetase
MSPEELRGLVAGGSVDTVVVAFCDPYGRLLGKRLDAEFFLDTTLDQGSHVCDYLFTVDMEMEPIAGYEFAGWDRGYGDVHLLADLSTLRRAAWAAGTVWVMCDVVDRDDHRPVRVAPRSVLRAAVERLSELGFDAMAGSELEFFLYRETYREAAAAGYAGLEPAGWYVEDYHLLQGARVESFVGAARRVLRESGIGVESSKGEWGRGQHEINIRFTGVLEMADRHVLMKHAMKELAESSGLSVTFMAKPHETEAGSSSHLHVSLWRDGANAFVGDDGAPTDVFRWFLGGWMAHVPELMVCYAPTVNSYKRYRDQSWAPTSVAWAHDNRTTGFRVVGSGPSLRIECRIPGADVNPYLAYAAVLASGAAGIAGQIEPPAALDGNAYGVQTAPPLAATLEHAAAAFRSSAFARRAFGDDVVDHYAHFHEVEVLASQRAVTDWERRRYFERI